MIIVTACYGDAHRPYLGVLLESLKSLGLEHQAVVVHDGIPWMDCYAVSDLKLLDADFGVDRITRVARKLRAWSYAAGLLSDGDDVVFLDADTVVLRDLNAAFQSRIGFDVAWTQRESAAPWGLNTGVVFMRLNANTRNFLKAWTALTEALLSTNLSEYVDATGRWGAYDQAAFAATRAFFSGKEALFFEGLPARVWNETRCPGNPDARVRHLKGLLPYLLGEKEFEPKDEHFGHDHSEIFDRWRAFYHMHRLRVGETQQ